MTQSCKVNILQTDSSTLYLETAARTDPLQTRIDLPQITTFAFSAQLLCNEGGARIILIADGFSTSYILVS